MPDSLLVITTLPDSEAGERLATKLVKNRLAACVNITPQVTSIYEWDGKMQRGSEVMLVIKTRVTRYAEVEQAITDDHPYELPEVIALPITAGLSEYLNWIDSCTKS